MTKPEPSEEDLRGRGGRSAVHAVILEELLEHVVERRALGQVGRGFGGLVLDDLGGGNVDHGLGDLGDEVGEVGRAGLGEPGAGAPARPAISASARTPRGSGAHGRIDPWLVKRVR